MSLDKSTFKSIYEDLVFNKNEGTASAKTADNLIQLGWLLGQSSIALWVVSQMIWNRCST